MNTDNTNDKGSGHTGPDDRDLDDGGLDLTPRDAPVGGARGGVRRWGAIGVLVLLVAAVGFVIIQASGATLFYKNADEAVAEKADLGTSRFRLQGTVVGSPDRGEGDQPSRFTVAYNGVSVDVVHTGSEPTLFKSGLPVVVEGQWSEDGRHFESTRLLVKHTEDYKKKDDGDYDEKHPERVDDEDVAAAGAEAPA